MIASGDGKSKRIQKNKAFSDLVIDSNKSVKVRNRMKKGRKRDGWVLYDYEAAFRQSLEDIDEFFVKALREHNRKMVYALKEIIAGDQLEIEIYPEFGKMEDVPEEGRIKKDNSAAQRKLNDKNSRKNLERLINTNFGRDGIWITLTYSRGNEPADMEEARKDMQNYIERLRYRRRKRGLPAIRYVYVIEYSPECKIRFHHHLVMDGDLDQDTVEKAWKLGKRNETRRLEPDEYGLTGMAKYITKEPNRKKGEKRWSCSTNLRKPKIRKVHSKRPAAGQGTYKAIEKYVDGFVKDRGTVEEQMRKWYPDYTYTDSEVLYNGVNRMFYVRARMRRAG